MSRLPESFHEDKRLRDAARAVLMADIDHARETLSSKGMVARVAGRIGDGAKDVFEVAKFQADDKRGVIAILLGGLFVWLARGPIAEIFGIEPIIDDEAGAAGPEGEIEDATPLDEAPAPPETDTTSDTAPLDEALTEPEPIGDTDD